MDVIEQGNALLRILQKADPDRLNDEQWIQRVQQCTWFVQTLESRITTKVAELFQ